MTVRRLALSLFVACSLAPVASAQKKAMPAPVAAQPTLLDLVAPAHREAVGKVMAKPTLSAKATEEGFAASPKIYEWLLEHPDRTTLAWQRLNVPCVEITDLGRNTFAWSDDSGSQLTWEPVAKFPGGVVWYATGKVKAAALFPMVPVKAVAVLRYPMLPTEKPGVSTITPEIQVYLQTDSRAAAAVMRMAGPAGPKMAEDGAGQLLYFFSGVACYLQKHPEKSTAVLAPAPLRSK